jgi:hypothetical protein
MQPDIHFISGLPRSGSTLFAVILCQNPRFHAAMTSSVGSIYLAVLGALSRRPNMPRHFGRTRLITGAQGDALIDRAFATGRAGETLEPLSPPPSG